MRNTGYITITVEESADWEVWRELVAMPPEERNIFVKKILSQALAIEPAPAEASETPPQDVPDEEIPAPAAEAQAPAAETAAEPAAKIAAAEPAAEFAKYTWGYRYTLDGAAPAMDGPAPAAEGPAEAAPEAQPQAPAAPQAEKAAADPDKDFAKYTWGYRYKIKPLEEPEAAEAGETAEAAAPPAAAPEIPAEEAAAEETLAVTEVAAAEEAAPAEALAEGPVTEYTDIPPIQPPAAAEVAGIPPVQPPAAAETADGGLTPPPAEEILWMGPSGEPASPAMEPEAGIWLDAASAGPETITWLSGDEDRGVGTDTGGGIMKPRATVPLEPEPAEKLTFIPAEAEEDTAPGAGLPLFLRNVVEEENDEELLDFFRRRREN